MRLVPIAIGIAWVTAAASVPAQRASRDTGQRIAAHTLLGVRMPTGRERDVFGPAFLIGGQVAVRMGRYAAAMMSVSAAQGDDRTHLGDNALTTVQYDVGVERRGCPFCGSLPAVKPFAGVGVGGRTYRHDRDSRPATTSATVYVAAGAELRKGRAGFRAELRDYLVGVRQEGRRTVWNDINLQAGLAYHFY
jgi:hypothetical protein